MTFLSVRSTEAVTDTRLVNCSGVIALSFVIRLLINALNSCFLILRALAKRILGITGESNSARRRMPFLAECSCS